MNNRNETLLTLLLARISKLLELLLARIASRSRPHRVASARLGRKPTLSLSRNMVKGSIGLGLTVKAGKDNASKNVTSDAYITVENLGDEADGAAQTCDIIVSVMEHSAADITKYLLAKEKGLDGIEALSSRYDEGRG